MELQDIELLDIGATEKILQEFNCSYIFKWRIPDHPDHFFWKKCPDTGDYRLFIMQGAQKTLFADSDIDTKSKYSPFLEEFVIDFKVYSGKQDKEEVKV